MWTMTRSLLPLQLSNCDVTTTMTITDVQLLLIDMNKCNQLINNNCPGKGCQARRKSCMYVSQLPHTPRCTPRRKHVTKKSCNLHAERPTWSYRLNSSRVWLERESFSLALGRAQAESLYLCTRRRISKCKTPQAGEATQVSTRGADAPNQRLKSRVNLSELSIVRQVSSRPHNLGHALTKIIRTRL